jgi:hypothetical protein
LPEGGDAFQMQMTISWEAEVSPWLPAVRPSKCRKNQGSMALFN